MVVVSPNLPVIKDAAVAQWVNAFPLQTEGWVFKSQPRQIVVKTGNASTTSKRSAVGVSATGHQRWPW